MVLPFSHLLDFDIGWIEGGRERERDEMSGVMLAADATMDRFCEEKTMAKQNDATINRGRENGCGSTLLPFWSDVSGCELLLLDGVGGSQTQQLALQ